MFFVNAKLVAGKSALGARVHFLSAVLLGIEDVLPQVFLIAALIAAVRAGVRLQAEVNAAVPEQLPSTCSLVVALKAPEGPLTCVLPLVFFQQVAL